MVRTILCSVAGFALTLSSLAAAETKGASAKGKTEIHATFVKADLAKHTVVFKVKDKAGKEVERTLSMAKDAKILGEDNKAETLEQFASNIGKEKDKSILIVEDKEGKHIVELRDLPSK